VLTIFNPVGSILLCPVCIHHGLQDYGDCMRVRRPWFYSQHVYRYFRYHCPDRPWGPLYILFLFLCMKFENWIQFWKMKLKTDNLCFQINQRIIAKVLGCVSVD
jgi:hypothetical protein